MRSKTFALFVNPALLAATARAQEFQPGDFWIISQALWVWSGCATPSPLGISTSTGLAVTFQP